MPTDSTRCSHSTWRSNGHQKGCKPLSRPTAWSDVQATVKQSPARIRSVARQRGTRNWQTVPPTIVIVPFQQNAPRLPVSVPRFGEHLELACKQQIGFLVVERIAPDQPPPRHRVAGGQLGNERPRRSEKLRDRQVVRHRIGEIPPAGQIAGHRNYRDQRGAGLSALRSRPRLCGQTGRHRAIR